MKVGEPLSRQRPPVHLPLEIIAHIISHLPSGLEGQSCAWSCCLVSRTFYSVAVSRLYERPRLLNGEAFYNFVTIISPPVNSHVRRVGLEQFVKHLNLSAIAYDSSNSQTARLLRRVAPTLESFVAPAVSFS